MEQSGSSVWRLNIPDENSLSPLGEDPEYKTFCFDFKLSIQSKKTLTFDDIQHTLLTFEQQYSGDTNTLIVYMAIMAKASEELTEVSKFNYDADSFCLVSYPVNSLPSITDNHRTFLFLVKHPDNPLVVSYKLSISASGFKGENYLQFTRPWLRRLFPKYYELIHK